jgi:hypothetical protein
MRAGVIDIGRGQSVRGNFHEIVYNMQSGFHTRTTERPKCSAPTNRAMPQPMPDRSSAASTVSSRCSTDIAGVLTIYWQGERPDQPIPAQYGG